jgi:TolA-binding protein
MLGGWPLDSLAQTPPPEEESEEGTGEAAPGPPAETPTAPEKEAGTREGTAAPADDGLPKCDRKLPEEKEKPTEAKPEAPEEDAEQIELEGERLEYQKAIERYVEVSGDYDREALFVLGESIEKRKGLLGKRYDKQVANIELEERERRDDAIRRFEEFIEKYPNHPKYTPDAMFRLAELYFERSAVDYEDARAQYQKDQELYERGKIPSEPVSPERSYTDSIRVYRKLLSRFGAKYRYADAVYYLLGYTLNESGQDIPARETWAVLVEKFPKSDHAPEVILRIGEIHFDYAEYQEASQWYKLALTYSTSKYYDKALYKLAWTYFQMFDYDSAIKTFKGLIAYYDKQGAGEGAGSALREEAVDYLAKSLVEDDWNNDGLKDDNAGVERAMSYMSEGLPYELEIIEKYADSLYSLHDKEKYQQSIDAYTRLLARAPVALMAVDWQREIIKVHDILRDVDAATEARKKLADMFKVDSVWVKANANNPAALRKASQWVEIAMRERALWHHQRAQELKTEAKLEADPALIQQALHHYARAADAYREYLAAYPNEPQVGEMRFYLAETLYYSGQISLAADAYAAVAKDANANPTFREQSAWSRVKSLETVIADQVKVNGLPKKADPSEKWVDDAKPAPPPAAGEAKTTDPKAADPKRVVAEAIPAVTKSWIDAVDYYVHNGFKHDGNEENTSTLAYQVGEMYYRHKDLDEARRRFVQILTCWRDSDVATNAIANILNSYRDENDFPSLEKWADLAEKLQLGDKEAQAEIRGQIAKFKLGAQFQHAEALLESKRFLDAAREFERLADQNETAEWADKAYFNAATSYMTEKYYDSAVRIFEKLITDARYGKSKFKEESLFMLAQNYKLFFYFEKAIAAYNAHVTKYPGSPNRDVSEFTAARLQEQIGSYAQAAEAYLKYLETRLEKKEGPDTMFRVGGLYELMNDETQQERLWQRFIKTFANSLKPEVQEQVILAKMKLAQLYKKQKKVGKTEDTYREIINDYKARGMAPGSASAIAAAESDFELVDSSKWIEFGRVKLKGPATKQRAELARKKKMLAELQQEYARLFEYKALSTTICAYKRLGDLFREFADTLYQAPEPTGLSEDELEVFRTMIEDEGLKFENVAIERLGTTVEKARELKVTNQCARQALEAINKFQPDKYPLFKEEKQRTVFEPTYSLDVSVPEAR